MERPFCHLRTNPKALILLVIRHKMLQAGRNTRFLQPVNIRRGNHAAQVRVFGKTFKVAPRQRGAVNVDRGRQQHMRLFGMNFRRQRRPHLFDKFTVPRRPHRHPHGEADGGLAQIIIRPAHPIRPVADLNGGNA
jgi:hypothetical protein